MVTRIIVESSSKENEALDHESKGENNSNKYYSKNVLLVLLPHSFFKQQFVRIANKHFSSQI